GITEQTPVRRGARDGGAAAKVAGGVTRGGRADAALLYASIHGGRAGATRRGVIASCYGASSAPGRDGVHPDREEAGDVGAGDIAAVVHVGLEGAGLDGVQPGCDERGDVGAADHAVAV